MSTDIDLLVLGGGTAGIVAARTAAGFGADVLLVEQARTGGDCLWTGCVPSKSLLAAAGAAAAARRAPELGVHTGEVTVDFAAVMGHVRRVVATIAPADSPPTLTAAGITVRTGRATLTGPRTADVDGETVRFAQAVITTGAAPTLPPIDGLDAVPALTSDSVWDLVELPARLVVLGGGSIGCELGQAFARLGSAVTLVEGADRLLPNEDPDASAAVTEALRADGVDVRTGRAVTAVRTGVVVLGEDEVGFDEMLVAVGRTSRTTGLGLDVAGVDLDDAGHVVVDAGLRTSNPRIFAAGDVTAHPSLTHVAAVHGSLAASNAVLGLRRSVPPVVPRVTFTHPEVASVGRTTAPGLPTVHHHDTDRAVAEGSTAGFTRLATDRRRRIVGATVVGPRAGESLAELTLAVARGLTTSDLAGVTHPYPTWGDAGWNAAVGDVRARLAGPVLARGTRALAGARRAWLARR